MFEDLVDFEALSSVFDKQLRDEVFALGAHVAPHGMIEGDLLIDGLAPDLLVILTIEGQVSTKHQVDDDAE